MLGKVLITGSSGFVGFRTLVSTLEAGYPVLAAVPCKEEADIILAALSIKKSNSGSALNFVTIPDIAADHALSEAVKKDVQYIIHTDLSMTADNGVSADHFQAQIIQPLLKGTNNVLAAANSTPGVKRVVMTSSLMGLVPYPELFQLESFNTFSDASPIPTATPPYPTAMAALCAGHAKALSATSIFLTKNKPHFTVVNLMPSIIIGHNELAKTTKDFLNGGNLQAFRHLRGEKVASKLPSHTVFIDDVARIHSLALDITRIPNTQNFVLCSGFTTGSNWYRAKEFVKERYMDEVKKGWLSLDGEQPVNRVNVQDAGKTMKAFGIKFADFEKQIKSLLDQFVALKAKEEKE
ncbi:MAG: hypothetical protein Q9186_002186 [Xanthomendoza sp. 1 TL-2023]